MTMRHPRWLLPLFSDPIVWTFRYKLLDFFVAEVVCEAMPQNKAPSENTGATSRRTYEWLSSTIPATPLSSGVCRNSARIG